MSANIETSTSHTLARAFDEDDLAARIESHAERRKTLRREKVEKASKANEIGNAYLLLGEYDAAIIRYQEAYALDVMHPAYPSNLAMAEMERGRYVTVEKYATEALVIQPHYIQARYQRLRGRKARGLYRSAMNDARALLRIDPDNFDAKRELEELEVLISASESQGLPLSDFDNLGDEPNEDEPSYEIPPEDWSDSEDAFHQGNRIPCRHYNRYGCSRGKACQFCHAIDDFSVRDGLGQNVCLFYLVGICKFGQKCNYSHSKAALPADRWWNDPEAVRDQAETLKKLGTSGVFLRDIVKTRKDWWRETNKGWKTAKRASSGKTGKKREVNFT